MRFPRSILLISVLVLLPSGSQAEEKRPASYLYLKSTELSTYLEGNFSKLSSKADPGPLYRAARSAIDSEDEGLVRAGERRFLLAPLFVRERVGAFRGKALGAWRAFAEPEARGARTEGHASLLRENLQSVVFRFPNTLAALEDSLRLADIQIEAGEFVEALDVLEGGLSWEGPPDLMRRLATRADFARSRLHISPPAEGDSFLRDARNARQLASAFNRPLGKVRWDDSGFPNGCHLHPVLDGRLLLGLSRNRIVAVTLRGDGSPAGAAPVWRFASSILGAACLGGRAFFTSKPEASPWRLHSGRRERATNSIFALDPTGEGLLWEKSPGGLTGAGRKGSVFSHGMIHTGGKLVTVTTSRSSGSATESVLLHLDPEDGEVLAETFLFVKGPGKGNGGGIRGANWTLLPARGGLVASDGAGVLLFVRDGCVQWVRTYAQVPPADPADLRCRRTLVVVGNRLLASPKDGLCIYAIGMRDGSRIASRATPPVRMLARGEGGSVWLQGEGTVARVHVGDPKLRLRSSRTIPAMASGDGFVFTSLYAVPTTGGLLLIGSSGRFLRSIVQPGAVPAFLVREGVLYRLRRDALSAFRIPETMADRALSTIPYIAGASKETAQVILIPWLESEDPRLRRWAADLLREKLGRPFDFDPDGPAKERRRAVEALRKALAGGR